MNDECTAQLCSNWSIPAYLCDNLWIEGFSGTARAEGSNGLFELDAPSPEVTVYWRDVDTGVALACLPWQADSLEWDGRIKIGGYVDAMHLMQLGGLAQPVTVLYVGGQPLRYDVLAHPGPEARAGAHPLRPDFHSALMTHIPETYSTWLLTGDSPLLPLVQSAMTANQRLYCFGRLADDPSGWADHFALPIILEALTVFPS
ncbi:MAG: hypothetical protein ACOCYT_00615 [Chloroflexota bacterium]